MNNDNTSAKKVRKPFYKNKLLWVGVAAYILFVVFNIGLSLTPLKAAQDSAHIDKQSVLLSEVVKDPYHIFFYENDDEYRTVIVEPVFMFWKSYISTYNYKYDDVVKLAGWFSFSDADKNVDITAIPVRNYDTRVSYIEMGSQSDRKRMDVPYGEVTVFTWDKSLRWDDLNAVAYSSDDKALYHLEHERENDTEISRLRWLPVDENEPGE